MRALRAVGEKVEFIYIYDFETVGKLAEQNKKRNLIFSLISVVFVVLIGTFVALALTEKISYIAAWIIDSILTVPYVWIVILFIKVPPQYRTVSKFVSRIRDANKEYDVLTFLGEKEVVETDGIICSVLQFGDRELLLPTLLNNPFQQDKTYHLTLVGKNVVAYKEEVIE